MNAYCWFETDLFTEDTNIKQMLNIKHQLIYETVIYLIEWI